MKSILLKFTSLIILVSIASSIHAEDFKKFISLSGYWKFTIGDDIQWAAPSFNDEEWDQILVSNQWENQGYDDYNGYAWYRKSFNFSKPPANTTLYLLLGRIDDIDVVYLNGKVLGQSGSFPPTLIETPDRKRKYAIPAGFLKENGENVIAVRVYDSHGEGGIIGNPVGIYYDADTQLLNLNLTGRWKIHAGDNKEWKAAVYDDKDWKRIQVPSIWENEALPEYDGYAWYRVNFRVPSDFMKGDIYLTLGKIDDVDDVYLNGKYIGGVYDLKRDGEYRRSGMEYNARRIYKIDGSSLKRGELNTLAVRVYDGQGEGGIYEGPVGIMSSENYRKYKNKHYTSGSFWDFIFDEIFID
jgi:sialate O-acetylesterase